MTKRNLAITAEAINGYDGVETNAYFSSEMWLASKAGQALASRGYCRPIAAWASRGYSVRLQTEASDFLVKFGPTLYECSVERLG